MEKDSFFSPICVKCNKIDLVNTIQSRDEYSRKKDCYQMSELQRLQRVDGGRKKTKKKKKVREKCTRARWEEISGFGWIPISPHGGIPLHLLVRD
jgi:hypothetical protein